MYRSFVLGVMFFCIPVLVQAADRPTRVLSLNVCADQYLIALADRDQIAALSNYARNKLLSYYAAKAETYPVSSGSVEEVLSLDPDLIVAGSARRQLTVSQLRKRNLRIIEIHPSKSYQEIVDQMRMVAAAIGQTERGEDVIRKMDADLAAMTPVNGAGEAAYYQRRGFLTGTGSLLDDIMRRVGLRNLAARLNKPTVSRMPLESIIQANPDYLIMESEADMLPDNGTALLLHPVLADAIPRERHLFVPQSMTVCGGPFFPETVKRLHDQLHR